MKTWKERVHVNRNSKPSSCSKTSYASKSLGNIPIILLRALITESKICLPKWNGIVPISALSLTTRHLAKVCKNSAYIFEISEHR